MQSIKLTMRTLERLDFEFENYEANSFPTDLSIDWGDGSITSSYSHRYSESGIYNVTIKAKNLGWFDSNPEHYSSCDIRTIDFKDCNSLVGILLEKNLNLKTLDVADMKALEQLYCSHNILTSLDIKGCSSLRKVDCSNNKLSAEALNQIFNDLPQGKKWPSGDVGFICSSICFSGNPGSEDCDISILEKKGWRLFKRVLYY